MVVHNLLNHLVMVPSSYAVLFSIIDKYVEIETSLVAKFKEAHISADIPRMKIYASALQQFSKVSMDYLDLT